MRFRAELEDAFGPGRVRTGVPLAGYTTFKVGGPADFLVETRDAEEVIRALEIARTRHRKILEQIKKELDV